MPATGTPKFDGIAILDLTVDFTQPSARLTAKAAYVNTKTGETHGWTSGSQWSEETRSLLAALRQSMEQDIAARDFISEGPANLDRTPGLRGLGEHVGATPDAKQA